MDVATVDYWATSGRSRLHRSSAPAKIVAALLCLSAVVVLQNLFVVLAIFLLVLAAARRAGIPVGKFTLAALYPALFAVLFAVAQFHGDFVVPATTIAKAVTAASIVILLIATTPYPRLFAALRPVLPAVVVEALYITYRSTFILLDVLLDAFGVTETNWRDATERIPHFAISETPRFVGRAVAALAADPDVARHSGASLSSGALSREYGFTDLDGSRPDAWRYMVEVQDPGLPANADPYR